MANLDLSHSKTFGLAVQNGGFTMAEQEQAVEKKEVKPKYVTVCNDCVDWTNEKKYHPMSIGIMFPILLLFGFMVASICLWVLGPPTDEGIAIVGTIGFGIVTLALLSLYLLQNATTSKLYFFLDQQGRMHCHDREPNCFHAYRSQGKVNYYWSSAPSDEFAVNGSIIYGSFTGWGKKSKRFGQLLNNTKGLNWYVTDFIPQGSGKGRQILTVRLLSCASYNRCFELEIKEALELINTHEGAMSFMQYAETMEDARKEAVLINSELVKTLRETRNSCEIYQAKTRFYQRQSLRLIVLLQKWPQSSQGAQAARTFLEQIEPVGRVAVDKLEEFLDGLPDNANKMDALDRELLQSILDKKLEAEAEKSKIFRRFLNPVEKAANR